MNGFNQLLSAANAVNSNINKIIDNKVFYRKIFYKCKSFIEDSDKNYAILTGPRKVGKSTCLKQIKDYYEDSREIISVNFKKVYDKDEQWDIIFKICKDNSNTIYLIDEITYLKDYDKAFMWLAEECVGKESKIKVIITGSQTLSIRWWSSSAFSINAEYIKTSFIDFEEWLVYKEKISSYGEYYDCTEEDYKDYILNSSSLLKIKNNAEYLNSCINETINSSLKSYESIINIENIDESFRTDAPRFLYNVLLTLHNRVNIQTFMKEPKDKMECIRRFLNKEDKLKYDEIIDKSVIYFIKKTSKLSIDKLKNLLVFLMECDLILVTNCGKEYNENIYIYI